MSGGKNYQDVVYIEAIQIRLPKQHITAITRLVRKGIYPNRSEAVRDAVRRLVLGSVQSAPHSKK